MTVGGGMRTNRCIGIVAAVLLMTTAMSYVAAADDASPPIAAPNPPTDRNGLPNNPSSPPAADGANAPSQSGEVPQTLGTSFTAAEFLTDSSFFPPDTM